MHDGHVFPSPLGSLETGVSRLSRSRVQGLLPNEKRDESFRSPSREATDATYELLLARARALLARGESVVLDATWRYERHRQAAAQLAVDALADLVEFDCTAPLDVAAARVARRATEGADPSDASPEVLARVAEEAVPWPTAITIDTDRSPGEDLATALQPVDV